MNVLGIFPILLAQACMTNSEDRNCLIDDDCLDSAKCFHGVCKKCLSCKMLFRTGKDCVLDLEECGECLKGFEEIPVTHTSLVIKPCRPSKKDGKCGFSEHCPSNTYCFEGSCIKCFNCLLVNRVAPPDRCAKKLEDCGSCMLGFYEIPVTVDRNTKPCERKVTGSEPKTIGMSTSSDIILAFSVVVLFMLFAIWFTFKNSKRPQTSLNEVLSRRTTGRDMIEPSAPPFFKLFDISNPQVYVETEAGELPAYSLINEGRQTAKVFKLPDAPYYDNEAQRLIDGNELNLEGNNDSNDVGTNTDESVNDNTACASSQQINETVAEVDHRIAIDTTDAIQPGPNAEEGSSTPQEHESSEDDMVDG